MTHFGRYFHSPTTHTRSSSLSPSSGGTLPSAFVDHHAMPAHNNPLYPHLGVLPQHAVSSADNSSEDDDEVRELEEGFVEETPHQIRVRRQVQEEYAHHHHAHGNYNKDNIINKAHKVRSVQQHITNETAHHTQKLVQTHAYDEFSWGSDEEPEPFRIEVTLEGEALEMVEIDATAPLNMAWETVVRIVPPVILEAHQVSLACVIYHVAGKAIPKTIRNHRDWEQLVRSGFRDLTFHLRVD
eukprot:TRINITY_DN854_c1_g1_i1.p1 TRINITY_DN854_c1_g1~~TRINITY_DN854_c1_g1_i1.p1  ORF type:complete len:241 (+),score=43.72 TRINITY_DN854_c1_g1_i1:769-1491(+)